MGKVECRCVRDINIYLLLVLFTLFLFSPNLLWSQPVPSSKAGRVAENWYRHFAPEGKKGAQVAGLQEYKYNSGTPFYIFTFDLGGFVMVSADERAEPVIGYGFEGGLPEKIDHPALQDWLNGYARQIDSLKVLSLKSNVKNPKWEEILSNRWQKSSVMGVAPLVKTKWHQGYPFNRFCPADPQGSGGFVWAGCTPLAMAQIMKYWNYPARGIGQHDYVGKYHPERGRLSAFFNQSVYDWANMPDSVVSPTSQHPESLARLISDCGIASETDYFSTGSGAYEWQSANALKEFFDYSDSIRYLKRQYYSDDEWHGILKEELNRKRPVMYVGYNSSSSLGHTFVIDGYQENSYYHINFGWKGDADGYWALDKLTPLSFDFNFFQRAVIGIQPRYSPLKAAFMSIERDSSLSFQFADYSTGNPGNWKWKFGDGMGSTLQNPLHKYSKPGKYQVSLIVCSGTKCDTTIREFEVAESQFVKTDLILGGFHGSKLFFDYDNDNDLDVFLSGYPMGTRLLRNDSGVFNRMDISIPFNYNDASTDIADINNDGYLDMIISGETGGSEGIRTKLYINVRGTLKETDHPFYPVSGVVKLVDYNNDGLTDVFQIGTTGFAFKAALFKNLGNGKFQEVPNLPFPKLGQGVSACWYDLDQNGFRDVVICGAPGNWNFTTKVFLNSGNDKFVETATSLPAVNYGSVVCGDLDSDGDGDIIIGGLAGFKKDTAALYRNDSMKLVPVPVPGLKGDFAQLVDFDSDGLMDFILNTKLFKNNHKSFDTVRFDITGTNIVAGDYNNDGKIDLFVSGFSPVLPVFYCDLMMNVAQGRNYPPSVPANLDVQIRGGKVLFTWNNSIDLSTASQSLSYNIRIGTTPSGCEIVSPLADASTGFIRFPAPGNTGLANTFSLLNLPPGKYYWSVQALDNGFSGSGFAPEQTFQILPTDVTQVPVSETVLYPNPASDKTMVRFSGYFAGPAIVSLCRMDGTEVSRQICTGNPNVEIDLSGYGSGIYLVRISRDAVQETHKLVISRN